jgi:multidrug efflux system outer membrane protein
VSDPWRSNRSRRHRWRRTRLILLAIATSAGGCTVGSDYVRPPVVVPESFKSQPSDETAAAVAADWWRLYREPDLDRLVTAATFSNQTLKVAAARVDEARALARAAASLLAPTVTLDPSIARTRFSGSRVNAATGGRASAVTVNTWLVPIDLTYEVDVWGRVRRSIDAARAQVAASADDEAAVRLTVQTDVAQFYYTLRLFDAQAEILADTVAAFREQVRVLSVQVRTGLASPLALSQAEAQLRATLAQQRDIQRARGDQEHALATLCGIAAPAFTIGVDPLRDTAAPEVPVGLPSALLERRPDIAFAEQMVIAANAQIGVTKADFFPRLSLTGAAGFESATVQSLLNWQSRMASIVAGLTQPVFNRGRLKANLEVATARHHEAVAAYVNQTLIAYGDVEDALTDLHALREMTADLRDAVSASANYRRLAEVQYRNGLVDYLVVIDAERTLLANRLALAQSVGLQLGASIRLIKALGGGWGRV